MHKVASVNKGNEVNLQKFQVKPQKKIDGEREQFIGFCQFLGQTHQDLNK